MYLVQLKQKIVGGRKKEQDYVLHQLPLKRKMEKAGITPTGRGVKGVRVFSLKKLLGPSTGVRIHDWRCRSSAHATSTRRGQIDGIQCWIPLHVSSLRVQSYFYFYSSRYHANPALDILRGCPTPEREGRGYATDVTMWPRSENSARHFRFRRDFRNNPAA